MYFATANIGDNKTGSDSALVDEDCAVGQIGR
jgi:hypothetical protein